MDESLVKYSKLSIITATNRFSIWTGDKQEREKKGSDLSVRHWRAALKNRLTLQLLLPASHQEWAEEHEGDKVEVGKVGATAPLGLRRRHRRVRLTLLAPQTRQHDLLPRFSCGAPACEKKIKNHPVWEGASQLIVLKTTPCHLEGVIQSINTAFN